MKILFIFPYFAFESSVSNHLSGILNSLNRGHEIFIVLFSRNKKGWHHSQGVTWYFTQAISFSFNPFISEFPFFLHLDDIVRQIRPDLIHINNLPFLTSFQSTIIAKRMQIPSILHVHGVIGIRNKILNVAQYMYIRTIMRKAFHYTTRVICLTRNDAFEIQKLGCPYEKIRIIPNGVDVERFKPCNEPTDDVIFWGGRFIPEKGLEYLIKALALIVKEKTEVKLILAGYGPLFPKIYNLVKRYELKRNVIFKGPIPHDEMPKTIGTATIVVLPSLKEGMPYALLEAMACGKAVVGSDISGINDVIINEVNGIIVPPKDPKALAGAIIRLLEDRDLRRRIEENARQLVVEKYSCQKIANKIERIYYEAISEIDYLKT